MPKVSLIYVFCRIIGYLVVDYYIYILNIIFFVAFLSVLVGNFLALFQIKIKRLLAYSSIGHVGFIFSGIFLCTESSFFLSFIYLFIYLLLSINIFSLLIMIRKFIFKIEFKNIVELSSLIRSNFFLGLILILIFFSLAGIPPFAGFFSKFYILYLLVISGKVFFALFLVLMSVVSCSYYIRVIRFIIFFNKIETPINLLVKTEALQVYFFITVVFFNFFFIFFQGPFIHFLLNLNFSLGLCL